jgi:hypothetical protein
MASVIEAARAAQAESQRIREQSIALRDAVRVTVAAGRAMTQWAAAAAARDARRTRPIPSPWSTLEWLRSDDEVDRALVPVD